MPKKKPAKKPIDNWVSEWTPEKIEKFRIHLKMNERVFARHLLISPNTFKLVLQGDRALSLKESDRISNMAFDDCYIRE